MEIIYPCIELNVYVAAQMLQVTNFDKEIMTQKIDSDIQRQW